MNHPSSSVVPDPREPADPDAAPSDPSNRRQIPLDPGFPLHHPGWTQEELGFDPSTSVAAMRALIDRMDGTIAGQGWTFLCAQRPLDPERLLAWDGLLGVVLQAARDMAPTVWDGTGLLLVNYPDAWTRVVPMLNPGPGWADRIQPWTDSIVDLIDLLLDEQRASSLLPDGCLNLDGLYERWRHQVSDGRLRVISLDLPPPVPGPSLAPWAPDSTGTPQDPGMLPRGWDLEEPAGGFTAWRTHPSNDYPMPLREALWAVLAWLARFEGVPLGEDLWVRHGAWRRTQELLKNPALHHAPHLREALAHALHQHREVQQAFRAVTALGAFKGRDHYLPLLEGLPLRRPEVDLAAWHDGMLDTFPWMGPAITALTRQATIQRVHDLPLQWSSLLLLGESGVGKTLFWQTAMARLGHPTTTVGIAGVSDSVMVKGTAAGWSSEKPSLPARTMVAQRCGNPVILLDELDRAGTGDQNGNVYDALLSLLDPVTAQHYPDECLLTDLDASRISWMATAQDEARLPAALRARFDVVEVTGPDWARPEHVDAALRMGEEIAWQRWDPALRTPATVLSSAQHAQLRRTRWTSLRSLGRAIAALLVDNLYEAAVAQSVQPATVQVPDPFATTDASSTDLGSGSAPPAWHRWRTDG